MKSVRVGTSSASTHVGFGASLVAVALSWWLLSDITARSAAEQADQTLPQAIHLMAIGLGLLIVLGYIAVLTKRKSEELGEGALSRMIENLPGTAFQWKWRHGPDPQNQFEFVARSVWQLVGTEPQSLLTNANVFWDYVLDSDRDALEAAMDRAAKRLEPLRHDFRVTIACGEVRWLRMSARLCGDVKSGQSWIGAWSDVTRDHDLAVQRSSVESGHRDPARLPTDAVVVDLGHDLVAMDQTLPQRKGGEESPPVGVAQSAAHRAIAVSPAPFVPLPQQTARPHLNRLRANGPSFSLSEIVKGLKDDEFEPVFQPKVSLATGRMKGAEALARWRHPQEGLIAPYAFIQTLEDNGLIDSFTLSMLRKSAAFCRRWRSVTGFDVEVSVNLSSHSLTDITLTDQLLALVQAEGVKPSQMVLEITESASHTESGLVLDNLDRLAAKGFGLSMDDYGTGSSSSAQLTRIPFTELTVDRSLVTNACNSEAGRDLLKSTLDLARAMNVASVAQGVETQEDWDLLRQIGCDMAQGYREAHG